MGDERQNTGESMADILQAMQAYYPGTLEAVRSTYRPQAQAEFDITKEFTPQYAQLTYDTLSGPGRKLSELGRELSKEEQLGAAQTELDIATGVGPKLAQAAADLQQIVEPEYYQARGNVADAINKSLSAIDPNALTKGETETIARGLGRTGSAVPSAMQTALQAQTFGDALSKRRAEYNQALAIASGSLPSLRTGFTGFEVGTKRQILPNWGQGQYTGIQTPGVNTSNQFGSQYLNNATAIQQQVMQKQKSTMDQIQQGTEITKNIVGSVAMAGA